VSPPLAIGIKSHSGWAALVALGKPAGVIEIIDRRRIELVTPPDASWARQPYHAAQKLPKDEAAALVVRAIDAARQAASREMRAILERARRGHRLEGCAILVGAPMPDWTAEQILSVHMRMHKAEGWLFPTALAQAAVDCGIRVILVRESELSTRAAATAGLAKAASRLAGLGKQLGPPWGKDQKTAALAALLVFEA